MERYATNPKFRIMDIGYRGRIEISDVYREDETIEDEYIRDYGMAYVEGDKQERAVGVFVRDLARLSEQIQSIWWGHQYPVQQKCKISPWFEKDLIYGDWGERDVWIFRALLDEMKLINRLCTSIGIPKLFRKEYGADYYDMPEGYRYILLPTLKNYYDFVLDSVYTRIVI